MTQKATAASPLITFAVYFGCWHAIRHTARLVPKLPKSMALLRDRSRVVVLLSAFTPGLYAVAATLAGGGLLIAPARHTVHIRLRQNNGAKKNTPARHPPVKVNAVKPVAMRENW